jgi:hypothetical protein
MIFSTIHISSTNIKLTAIKRKQVYKWDVFPLEKGLVRDGRIVDPPRVGEAIDNLFETASVPKNNVIITVSGLPYTYRVMDFPRMKPELVRDAIYNNLASEFAVPVENLYISWAPVNTKPDSIEYFVMAVDRQFVNAVVETAKFARITNWSLDIRPLALARAATQTDAIVVSMDYDYVDMVLVQNGQVKDMHSANVDMDVDSSNRKNYFNMFASELAKLISYHSNTKNAESMNANTPVIVTGEALSVFQKTVDSAAILEELNHTIGYPVQYMETWIPYPESFVEADYATNLGLGLRRLKNKSKTKKDFHDIKLDILRGTYDKKPQTLNISYIVLPAVVVIIAVLIPAIMNANEQKNTEISRLQDELTVVNRNLKQAQSAKSAEQNIQDKIAAVTAEIQTSRAQYTRLLGTKGHNTPELSGVTNAVPFGVEFRHIVLDDAQITITGVTANPFNVVTYVRELEESAFSNLNIEYVGDLEIDSGYPFTVVINKIVTP